MFDNEILRKGYYPQKQKMLQIVHITVAWSLSSVMRIPTGPNGWGEAGAVWSINLGGRSNRARTTSLLMEE